MSEPSPVQADQHAKVERLLIVLPSWVGDVVMASPMLRALRQIYPTAQITGLLRANVRPMVDGSPWFDRLIPIRRRRERPHPGKRRRRLINLAGRLRRRHFDTAVLLPNSFRTALLVRAANIPRRVGYDRDGRGFLLTDRLLPLRRSGQFIPVSAVEYYLGIARYLGAEAPDAGLELHAHPQQEAAAEALLAEAHVDAAEAPLVLINPGTGYGAAKRWDPQRFAAVADALIERHGVRVLLNGAPDERPVLDAVHAAARHELIDLRQHGCDLGVLKGIIRRCALMITNDTGPRHIAAAFGVPVVTIFGPTDPCWSQIDFAGERQVQVDVFCGPCQKKTCPLDHRCMTLIDVEMVLAKAEELLAEDGQQQSRTAEKQNSRT